MGLWFVCEVWVRGTAAVRGVWQLVCLCLRDDLRLPTWEWSVPWWRNRTCSCGCGSCSARVSSVCQGRRVVPHITRLAHCEVGAAVAVGVVWVATTAAAAACLRVCAHLRAEGVEGDLRHRSGTPHAHMRVGLLS